MSFRVKDFNKNVIAEFDTLEELDNYVSSSQFTSSLSFNDESASLNYFQYDDGIHESLISGGLADFARDIIRITYIPGQDDDIPANPEPIVLDDSGSVDSGSIE